MGLSLKKCPVLFLLLFLLSINCLNYGAEAVATNSLSGTSEEIGVETSEIEPASLNPSAQFSQSNTGSIEEDEKSFSSQIPTKQKKFLATSQSENLATYKTEQKLFLRKFRSENLIHRLSAEKTFTGEGKKSFKIGNRREHTSGETSYKLVGADHLLVAIKHGIKSCLNQDKEGIRDSLTLQNDTPFYLTVSNSQSKPIYRFEETYPRGFHTFRKYNGIHSKNITESVCGDASLKEIGNSGASGSLFYFSQDDNYILKTMKRNEVKVLGKLLYHHYIKDLLKNPSATPKKQMTLLPEFYGMFAYRAIKKEQILKQNIPLVLMNNLLPSGVELAHKFDLKGSTYKRVAMGRELGKTLPTFKDVDFNKKIGRLWLNQNIYNKLMQIIVQDTNVLKNYNIMDYSLLMGIHPVGTDEMRAEQWTSLSDKAEKQPGNISDEKMSPVPAIYKEKKENGDEEEKKVLLYIGIIDILQTYRPKKMLEQLGKTVVLFQRNVSVAPPGRYARRFQKYMRDYVFGAILK